MGRRFVLRWSGATPDFAYQSLVCGRIRQQIKICSRSSVWDCVKFGRLIRKAACSDLMVAEQCRSLGLSLAILEGEHRTNRSDQFGERYTGTSDQFYLVASASSAKCSPDPRLASVGHIAFLIMGREEGRLLRARYSPIHQVKCISQTFSGVIIAVAVVSHEPYSLL
jgi:hypothetical protein